ncbi:MAG TPA: NAD(P)-dependent oxidoreductase [Nitrolancea sp.]|nr:NAD(P)-dependent oxidoreductase [Nitrolancea sp.]
MRIGFIGLGHMGFPMTQNLLRAGFAVTVHNRSRDAVQRLAADGAQAADSAAEVAQQSDLVITCLPTVSAVDVVYRGDAGLLESAREGSILIDCSTVSPRLSREIYQAAKERGIEFLDAPISGGPTGAQAATLTIMAGGDETTFTQALPVFRALGTNIHHVGPSGSGSVVKLVNQHLTAVNTATVTEAIVLGAKAGADPQVLYDVIKTSFGGSTMFNRTLPLLLERRFNEGAPLRTMMKDLDLITDLGRELNVRLLLASEAREIYRESIALGFGEEDIAALVKPLERIAGIEVGTGSTREPS